MPKEKIAFISILKPVDDTRSYLKMALSLAKTHQYEIHLFGYPSLQKREPIDSIHFHPHPPFKRLSIDRFIAKVNVLLELAKVKPKTIVVNTPELLIVSILCKILFGTVLLYDIQENYYFNFIKQTNYPPIIKHILGVWVRLKEQLCSPIFDHFILAEASYLDELTFVKNRNTLIENKAIVSPIPKSKKLNSEEIVLVFSGTISISNGILRALALHQQIDQKNRKVRFYIIGHCPDNRLKMKLFSLQSEIVTLDISDQPIPYERIQTAIAQSDIGLVCYELNSSNQNCMPTKVYEYMAAGLPILFEQKTFWKKYIAENHGGLSIDFETIETNHLMSVLNQLKSWHCHTVESSIWYTGEEKKLTDLFESLKY